MNFAREAVEKPSGRPSLDRLEIFANYYRRTMPPDAAREAIEHMYASLGNPETVRRRHIEQQRAAEGGIEHVQ
jgi:ribosomal protein L20A (L18A)